MIRQKFTDGLAVTTAFLGVGAILAVLAFHFPEYLTTPQLRAIYAEEEVRLLLHVGLLASTIIGVGALVLGGNPASAVFGLTCTLLAWIGGGPGVVIEGPIRTPSFYISVDWLLLDLLLIATLFISIERTNRLYAKQSILRQDWQVDLSHYVINHLANGGLVFLISLPAATINEFLQLSEAQAAIRALPIAVQVIMIMALTDLVQYWVHRAAHRFPILWRFHRVHHSVETMDWLAGSRLHVVDILMTRAISLIPMVVLGFSNEAINIYLPILALQSVFIHCNVNYPLGFLRRIIATPRFHHWHHTADKEHLDKNFSVTFPFWDMLFGTYYCPADRWPNRYGLSDEKIGGGYFSHLISPLRSKLEHRD